MTRRASPPSITMPDRPPHGGSFTRAKSGALDLVASTAPTEVGLRPDAPEPADATAPATEQQEG